ncbi:MAG TPA: redoxin domain-containing protein, partial [Gammaproteobacteria bacterium]|nr:redoxin domain-containing protein [Gammaproteobacteria bacterium]
MALNIGDKAPDFTLLTDDSRSLTLKDLRGQKVVLYFYP